MICLRNDKESFWNREKGKFIKDLKKKYGQINVTDTVIPRNIDIEDREKELYSMWKMFRNSKVVITDRLHGMIFSFITKTPCIVLRSFDHKIIESYKWIENVNYIQFVEKLDFELIDEKIEEMTHIKEYTKTNFKETYFKDMINEIKTFKI